MPLIQTLPTPLELPWSFVSRDSFPLYLFLSLTCSQEEESYFTWITILALRTIQKNFDDLYPDDVNHNIMLKLIFLNIYKLRGTDLLRALSELCQSMTSNSRARTNQFRLSSSLSCTLKQFHYSVQWLCCCPLHFCSWLLALILHSFGAWIKNIDVIKDMNLRTSYHTPVELISVYAWFTGWG